jgi:diguanylate cyclase (GGDEF)-like protein/putative nucleotidyltransferase with HDIG domain
MRSFDGLPWQELVDRAHEAQKRGQRNAARDYFEAALWRLREANDTSPSRLVRSIARCWQVDAQYDEAFDCLTAAEAIAEAHADESAIGHAINVRGIIHWQRGELDAAQALYRQALDIALRVSDTRLAAMAAQNMGVVANVRGDFTNAMHYYRTSLNGYRSLGLPRDVYIVQNNLGRLYTEQKKWDEAERAYDEALHIATALGELSGATMIDVNVAEMWVRRGEFPRAREACDRAMQRASTAGDEHADAEAYKIYGIIEREAAHYSEAEQHFARAEEGARRRHDVLLQAQIAHERAELFRRQGRNRDLLLSLNRAHQLYAQLRAQHAMTAVNHESRRLEKEFLDVVQRWGESIEETDEYTLGHCERVADLACTLAQHSGVDERSMFWLRVGALLHDVGKIVIPPDILNKPDKLSPDEWALMRQHTVAGVDMLRDIEFPLDIVPVVRSHHENWDGSGYPDGLAQERIPLWARIVCIVDAYDALTSERSYKPALGHWEAMQAMQRDVGRQFDPTLFSLFEEMTRAAPPPARDRATAAARVAATTDEAADSQDELTRALRRGALFAVAQEHLAGNLEAKPVSLLVVDVDHFKLVNDTFGHLQGDEVLRGVAARIRTVLREGDVLGRYAGDEFVVVLPDTPNEKAVRIADRLRRVVENDRLAVRGTQGASVGVTLSIGIATAPEDARQIEELFAEADRALYEAKRGGRNAFANARASKNEEQVPSLQLERFVGRVDDLRRLIRAIDTSFNDQPGVVAITGEAGIGKSTLVRQLRPEVRLRNGAMVAGRSLEADVKPPYGAWGEVIDGILATGLVPAREWRELTRIVPSMAQNPSGANAAKGELGNRYALLAEIAEFLRLASSVLPLLIVLEDMQWADASTWDALEFVLDQCQRERLLFCLTIREEDSAAIRERRRRLSRDERYSELKLQRLQFADLQTWLETAFHQGDIGTEFPSFLHRYTEGNPLLVVHVLRSLYDCGAIWYTGKRWNWQPNPQLSLPTAVADLIERRLDRLSPDARLHLTFAAVIGRTFDIELALAAGDKTEDELLSAIDEGISAKVVEPVSGKSDHYAFTHGLIAEAIQRSVNPRRLRRLHERVAQALEQQRPAALTEIATHYDAAGSGDKAFQYAILSAERAVKVFAHDEAAASYVVAERHAPTLEDLLDVRFKHAQSLDLAGKYEPAESLCDLIIAESVSSGARNPMLKVRRLRERIRSKRGQPLTATLDGCRGLLEEAQSCGDVAEQIALLDMLSHTHVRMGDLEAAQDLSRRSLALAEGQGDQRGLADALIRLGHTLLERDPAEARGCYERALELFASLGDLHGQARSSINLGIAHSLLGAAEASRGSYETGNELAKRLHAPDMVGLAALNLGVLHMKLGEHAEAEQRFAEAMQGFRTVKNEYHRVAALYNLANLARERGDHDQAISFYDETIAAAASLGHSDMEIGAYGGRGLANLGRGRPNEARECLGVARIRAESHSNWWFQGRELVAALEIRLQLADGYREDAEAFLLDSLAAADLHDPYGAAWLVAEVSDTMREAGSHQIAPLVARYATVARTRGFRALAGRFENAGSTVQRPAA